MAHCPLSMRPILHSKALKGGQGLEGEGGQCPVSTLRPAVVGDIGGLRGHQSDPRHRAFGSCRSRLNPASGGFPVPVASALAAHQNHRRP